MDVATWDSNNRKKRQFSADKSLGSLFISITQTWANVFFHSITETFPRDEVHRAGIIDHYWSMYSKVVMRMLLVYRCIVIGISNRCIDVLFTSMRGVVNIIIFKKILVWCQRTWCYEWEEDGGGGKTRENNRAVHVTEIAYRAYRARTLIRLKWLFQHTTLVDSRPTWTSYARCQLLHWPLQETNPIWTKYKGHWRDDVQEQGWTLKQKIQMCHSYGIPLYPIQSKTNEQTSKHTINYE